MNKKIILPLSSLLLLASCATAQEVTNNDYLTAKVLTEARRNADALTLVSGQSTSLDDRSVIYPRNVASFVDYSSAETRLEVHRYDGSLWVKAEEERETGTKANRYHGQQSLSTLVDAASQDGIAYLLASNVLSRAGSEAVYDTILTSQVGATEDELLTAYFETLSSIVSAAVASAEDCTYVVKDGDDVLFTDFTTSTSTVSNPLYPNDSEKALVAGRRLDTTVRFSPSEDGYRLVSYETKDQTQFFQDTELKSIENGIVASTVESYTFSYGEATSYDGSQDLPSLNNALAAQSAPSYLLMNSGTQLQGELEVETVGYQLETGERKLCFATTIDLAGNGLSGGTLSFVYQGEKLDSAAFTIAPSLDYSLVTNGEYRFENVESLYVEMVCDLDGSNPMVTIS